jgi:hypothetical protein
MRATILVAVLLVARLASTDCLTSSTDVMDVAGKSVTGAVNTGTGGKLGDKM